LVITDSIEWCKNLIKVKKSKKSIEMKKSDLIFFNQCDQFLFTKLSFSSTLRFTDPETRVFQVGLTIS